MAERITFQASNNITIVGDYVDAGAGTPHALLLHMMPATRTSYKTFAEKLKEAGFSSLAIDFRGHGESTEDGKLDYQKFSDAEHQASIHDTEAAVDWLKNKGAANIFLVGASIGANLTIQYMATHPEIEKGVILSAGLDYRGVKADLAAKKLQPSQAVYFAASDDDDYSLKSHRLLAEMTHAKKIIKELSSAGHGTNMFQKEPRLMDEIITRFCMGKMDAEGFEPSTLPV